MSDPFTDGPGICNHFPGYRCHLPAGHGGPCPLQRDYPTGEPPSWLERKIGGWTGDLIAWLGERAFDRGDMHEYEHCLRALVAGNSEHSRTPCTLDETTLRWVRPN
jgi:hypothetical protein